MLQAPVRTRQHRTRRRSSSGETESSWRHHHRKNNDERIRLQTGRRQPFDWNHAQSLECRQDAGRLERRGGCIHSRRRDAIRIGNRRRRINSDPFLHDRPRRAQGAIWACSSVANFRHSNAGACWARNVRDAALLFTAIAGYDARDPSSVSEPVPNVLAACRSSVAGMRLAWSPTLGYAEPDEEVVELCEKSALMLEDMGCIVEKVDRFFDEDPARLWTAEFYAGVGTRLRNTLKTKREILDPAVRDILDAALSQTMRDYYESVFARHAFYSYALKKFDDYDAVLSPVIPVSSLDCGLNKPARLAHRTLVSWVSYTYPFNLLGFPSGTLCAGLAGDGMPVGLL
jgi:Amidase